MDGSTRLVLVDGHSLAHRAYFALFAANRRFATADGRPTGAVYGFLNMLLAIMERYRPTHLAVVFDAPGPTFRHQRFAAYKAQRPGLASELGPQVQTMRELLRAMSVPVYEVPGFEADDVLGTMACWARDAGLPTLVVTGDRDALQLVDDHIHCLLTVRGITETAEYDPAAVQAQYGIKPPLMRDLKALMGDPSDNVPGVRGIGEKTALSLVQAYGPLEEIYARLGEVRAGRVARLLEEGKEQAFLSRELVTIACDAPVRFSLADLKVAEPRHPELAGLLESLEFRHLARRLYPEGVPAPAAPPAPPGAEVGGVAPGDHPPSPAAITLLETLEAVGEAAAWLLGCDTVAFDVAYQGTRPSQAALLGLGLAGRRGGGPGPGAGREETRAFSIPVHPLNERQVLLALAPLLSSPAPQVWHDAKTALVILGRRGLAGCGLDQAGRAELPGLWMDPAVAAYLIDPTRSRYDLDRLAGEFLRRGEATGRCGAGDPASAAGGPDPARRALVALELAAPLQAELNRHGLQRLWTQVELPLIGVLARMELAGVRLDLGALDRMDREFGARLAELTSQAHRLAGGDFNLNSTRQLAEVLFGRLGLPSTKKTARGKVASVDAETLEALADRHPLVPVILEHRSLGKLKGTYVDGLRALVDPADGRIRTAFHQTGTSTGRLSSSDPNLQNIPVREELGRQIRRAFVASGPEHVLLAADYSQIELRILAHLSGDPGLVEAFGLDQDIHRRTAAEVFGVALADVTGAMRQAAKAVNFGIIYGISDYGLARSLGVGRAEAAHYIAQYFARYRRVDEYFRETIAAARQTGYVTTLLGRRRPLPDLLDNNYNIRAFAERTARNTPIQGSAADLIKLAMVSLDRDIAARGWQGRMVLQVHDELLFDLPRRELAAFREVVEDRMQHAYPLSVPLRVDTRAAANWCEAK